jgi:tetratricopeptide (TPR) repeat protein
MLGESTNAITVYRDAADRYPAMPPAVVLGHVYAARALERAGRFDEALADYRAAAGAWDDAFDANAYDLSVPRPADGSADSGAGARVEKRSLSPRIDQLARSLSTPGGALLEQGRRLIAEQRYTDALRPLNSVIVKFPATIAAREAVYLSHQARFQRALDRANSEKPGADLADATIEFERLSREPRDFPVCAADIARSTILWLQGSRSGARKLLDRALDAWPEPARTTAAKTDLERDVDQIYALIFRPDGSGPLGREGWNGLDANAPSLPFVITSADIKVVKPDGVTIHVAAPRVSLARQRVLQITDDQRPLLQGILDTLGGSKKREPTFVMEVPNQPIGNAQDIGKFWNEKFAVRPGHWGGWVVDTYPHITEIRFDPDNHSKAFVPVVVGYSGATVVLERVDDSWQAKGLVNVWVE